jgi:outer membrane protein TolC
MRKHDLGAAWTLFVILFCFCIHETAAFAQQADDVESGIAQMIPAAGAGGTRQKPIFLGEAIQMAFANNKDVQLARQNVLAADWDLKGVAAQYEPRSTFNSSYERTKLPVTSFLSGGVNGSVVQSDLMAGYRLEGLAPRGGGSYEFNFSSRRFTTNNVFTALNPQYPSDLQFRYTQPHGRGRLFPARTKDIEIAKKNSQLTDTEFRKTATETIVNVKRAYWDLVYARNHLQILSEVLRDTRNQFELSRRRAGTGAIAAIDMARPEARVAESEQNAYRALEEVTRAENALKNLIAENSDSQLWNMSLIPMETVESDVRLISLQEALAAALDNRLELQETDIVREINAIEQRYFRDQTRPQVDLVSSYAVTGLGGSPVNNQTANPLIGTLAQSPLPGFLEGGYGQSLTNLAVNRFNSFRVGVQISLPLHNHAAEASLGRALVEGQRVSTQREKLKQLVQMDVRNAYQAVNVAESQRRAASVVRASLEQQYASEQRRVNVGYSTTDVVLERQIGLATARINELHAQTEQNKAQAELERAMGTALEANGVAIRSR